MKKIIIPLVALSACLALTGCRSNSNDNGSKPITKITKSVEKNKHAYKLAFFENRISDDTERQYFTLGYYKDGTLIKKDLDTSSDKFWEIIEPDIKTPYVRIASDGTYYIHRPPYSQYNQPLIKGKVTAKEND